MKIWIKTLALFLLLALTFPMVACGGGGETPPADDTGNDTKLDPVEVLPGFDYSKVALSQYVSFGDYRREDMCITIDAVAPVTEADVLTEFNSYFNATGSVYYRAVSDTQKAVADGDMLYLHYTGVTVAALEEVLAEGKIADLSCSGMSYSEILALGLGFQGGTTTKLTPLEIGSGAYIAGFESGLVGYVPSAAGEENPVRLNLTFPENYGNAELAGQAVVFFCKLAYIGDKTAGAYTADTITVELVNDIMGLTGENAYLSLEDCLTRVRTGLEQTRETTLRNAMADAIFSELVTKANIPTVPQEMRSAYVDSLISSYLSQFVDLYNNNYTYYTYYFGNAAPSEKVVAAYLGYTTDDYRAKMEEAVIPAVKQEMIFWYYVQSENITLSQEEIDAMRAEYTERYGASIFTGVSDNVVYEQFLRDKFVEGQITVLKANNNIIYKESDK